ncbi:MAG: hypothetical protein DA408_14915 [Bacteroidetes bacterium]|nr:MAG: hypothetical protein C7N36_01340 [Bacteroidota bacterium]PTM10915.1 MAG: hypothetical protein DA408_14915 [Bacteroidota bacterium]
MKRMKFPWTIIVVVLLFATLTNGYTNPLSEAPAATITSFKRLSDEVVTARIARINLPFAARSSSQVKAMIRRYTVEGYRDSEDILGRSAMYFPIFEHYLRLYNLPEALKYLPIVESSLLPDAESPLGAAGLWQFIPSTARMYGLKVNGQVDERRDPHKATEAAVRMLASLYEQFGDWSLVLAAYNCGPGRVRKAIRAANSTKFQVLKAFLPMESQHYVPRFVAAAYLMNYYSAHGLTPDYPSQELLDTRTFRLGKSLHLGTAARQLGVSYRTMCRLNPSFLQGMIPASEKGQYVTVPTAAATAFASLYLPALGNTSRNGRQLSSYLTVPGDDLETLAALFACKPAEIMEWNGLTSPRLTINQSLMIWLPRQVVRP